MAIKLVPDLIVADIHDITPSLLIDNNIRGVMVDLDNTLACYDEREPGDDTIEWVKSICDSGIKLGIISNNKQERVEQFNAKLGLQFNAARANKPFKRGYIEVARKMGLNHNRIAVVGDQIFTDVLGGNNVGMYTIMITSKSRTWNKLLAMRRMLEMPFIKQYERKRNKMKRMKPKTGV
ncbi:MAG: YqeG family HAD IIIA-type phosphatase [Clostridia bacterium]|nr:YqeG family HAD IIIA-type phosphatase [Clostridia bacterium]